MSATPVGKFLVTTKRCSDAAGACLVEELRSGADVVNVVDVGGDIWIGRSADDAKTYRTVGYERREAARLPESSGAPKHLAYRQTIHGTSGISRLPALFGIFRQKQTNPKRPTLVQHFRTAIQNNGFRRHSVSTRVERNDDHHRTVVHRVVDAFRTKKADVAQPRRATKPSGTVACEDCDPACFGSSRGLKPSQKSAGTIVAFLRSRPCYDLILNSGKIVIFDVSLSAKKAFHALIYHNVRSAPLWDSKTHRFVGMLTVTEFVVALENCYDGDKIQELEERRVESLRDGSRPLVQVTPDESLYDALNKLIENRVHRVPVIDTTTGAILYVLTNKAIMKYLFLYFKTMSAVECVKQKLNELNIGTYGNIKKLDENATVIAALRMFVKYRLSALPIVDSKAKLRGLFSKFDVMKLATEKMHTNLDVTLKQVCVHDETAFKNAHKCFADETLYVIIERFVKLQVCRLIVVDNYNHVIGIISLSDLLRYFIEMFKEEEILGHDVTDTSDLITN